MMQIYRKNQEAAVGKRSVGDRQTEEAIDKVRGRAAHIPTEEPESSQRKKLPRGASGEIILDKAFPIDDGTEAPGEGCRSPSTLSPASGAIGSRVTEATLAPTPGGDVSTRTAQHFDIGADERPRSRDRLTLQERRA